MVESLRQLFRNFILLSQKSEVLNINMVQIFAENLAKVKKVASDKRKKSRLIAVNANNRGTAISRIILVPTLDPFQPP